MYLGDVTQCQLLETYKKIDLTEKSSEMKVKQKLHSHSNI